MFNVAPATKPVDGFGRIDRMAMGLSGLCVLHCLLTIGAMGLFSVVGIAIDNPVVHEVGLGLAIGLAIIAIGYRALNGGAMVPVAVGSLGIGVMFGAINVPHGPMEAVWTITGALLVALGHYLNRYVLN